MVSNQNAIGEIGKQIQNILRRKQIMIPVIVVLSLSGIYFGSYWIIQGFINTRIEDAFNSNNNGENSTSPVKIDQLSILEMNQDYIDFNLSIKMEDSLAAPNLVLKINFLELEYTDQILTRIEFPRSPNGLIELQASYFNLTFRVDIKEQLLFARLISDYMTNITVPLTISGNFKILGIAQVYPAFHFSEIYVLNRTNSQNRILDFSFNNITANLEEKRYSLEVTIILNNSYDFSVNITRITGEISFNDPDGFGILAPMQNIHLMDIDLNWTEDPFEVLENHVNTRIVVLNGSLPNLLTFSRLSEEILQNKLHLNLLAGELQLQYGESIVNWQFALENIPTT